MNNENGMEEMWEFPQKEDLEDAPPRPNWQWISLGQKEKPEFVWLVAKVERIQEEVVNLKKEMNQMKRNSKQPNPNPLMPKNGNDLIRILESNGVFALWGEFKGPKDPKKFSENFLKEARAEFFRKL